MERLDEVNLKDQFLKIIGEEPTAEQLEYLKQAEYIYSLLEQKDYTQIEKIIEENTQSIVNNENLKSFVASDLSPFSFSGRALVKPKNKRENIAEDMKSQKRELFHILMLIFEYEREKNQYKKHFLEYQIRYTIESYRTHKEKNLCRKK